ncbi:unnamed protein product, partial [Brenthis ino]
MKMISVLVIVTSYLWSVQGQSDLQCTTPTGSMGQCISLMECPQLLALVQNMQRTPEELKLLRDSQCGFVESSNLPKVCCEVNNTRIEEDRRCFTPDGNEGTCVDLYTCPTLTNLLKQPVDKESKSYVQNSRCEGPAKYNVCCGPPRNPNVGTMRNCNPTAAPPDPRTECCGLDSSSGNKIFGGNVTAIDQYPWLTILEYVGTRDKKIKLLCGGVLISGRYVLTAAHCVDGPVLRVGKPTNVRLGEYNIGSSGGPDCVEVEGGGQDCTNGVTLVPIEKVIKHPLYDPASTLRRHDIALLRLQFNAPYNDFIRPICLPTSDIALTKPPLMLYAAGWGAVSEYESFSNIKLHVDLPYKTLQECQPSYNVANRRVQLWQGQLCAGGELGKDTCKGDSGGPLMLDNTRIYTVVGIVSFGPTPCGLDNVPGVYTKVYEYLPWIRTQMKP